MSTFATLYPTTEYLTRALGLQGVNGFVIASIGTRRLNRKRAKRCAFAASRFALCVTMKQIPENVSLEETRIRFFDFFSNLFGGAVKEPIFRSNPLVANC